MDNKEQKLVGYIVYNIWTYKHKGREDTEWTTAAISPEVHWKKKIYLTLSSAQEAAKHMKERESLSTQIIVPLYANYDDFNKVNEGYKELKVEIEKLNNNEYYSDNLYYLYSFFTIILIIYPFILSFFNPFFDYFSF